MKTHVLLLCCCLLLLPLPECMRRSTGEPDKNLIFVSILPQKYFVERIAGSGFTVKALIPAGASPHSFEPRPSQMAELAKARLYFSTGVEMEKAWLPRIRKVNPRLRVVACDSGIEKRRMEPSAPGPGGVGDGHRGHDPHGGGAELHADDHRGHDHEGEDPHIWLSPELVRVQVRPVMRALCAQDSASCAGFRKRLAEFDASIDSLQSAIRRKLERCGSPESFLVFHPSWGYFAREFSMRQIAVEIEGREPGVRELEAIMETARREKCSAMLVQPQFSRRIADIIAGKLGVPTMTADPLAEDWAANLLRVTDVLCR